MARTYHSTGSQPPSVELTVRQGPQPGQCFSLTRPTITIGREAGNDVVVSDPQVSRRHASLTWDGRQFIIQDLGSVNGTFVNGVRLTATQVLQSGDFIGLGSTVLLGFQALPVAPVHPEPRRRVEPPVSAPRPPARRRRKFLIPLTALLGLCFVLAVAAALGYFFLWPRPDVRPLVLINSPRHGEQVEVGQEVTVHSIARDEGKVTRVELWVDGQLQQSQTSNLPRGSSPFPLLARWQPSSPGPHTLIARAFNARGGRGQASVNVEAIEREDRDGDGVADEADACPDVPGPPTANGCPDRDGDGIPDAEDACPDEAGLPEGDGCPSPSEENRDGDGLFDEADACPDEPGSPRAEGCPDADADGVQDSEDACPEEPGPAEQDGCPVPGDMDGDGVPDAEDECPEESGLLEHAGCADGDGDGVRDGDDECPDVPGLPGLGGCPDQDGDGIRDRDDACPDQPGPGPSGCPDTGVGDRDGDGIPDDVDLCPNEPGPGPTGCPDPSSGGDDDEPPVPLWPPPGGGPFGELGGFATVIPVEFEALEFRAFDDYDEIYCYASLAGGDMERYGPFEALDGRQWDIAEHLGGENSRTVLVHDDEPLEVHVECGAYDIYRFPGGEEATYWDLGSFTQHHPQSDWDGHVIEQRSSGGSDGHTFLVSYRICRDSCSDVPFHPPQIWLEEYAGSAYLTWLYYGDPTSIRGFGIYRNGAIVGRRRSDEPAAGGSGWTPAGATRYTYPFPSSWRPACGTSDEFHVTTYGNNVQESPRSNTVTWEGPPCPRTVRVTFGTLQTHDLPDDESGYDSQGPIFGDFTVTGSDVASLSFNAAEWPYRCYQECRGIRIRPNSRYSIDANLFATIRREIAECPFDTCSPEASYSVPSVNYVIVELGPDDDLTIEAEIGDADSCNANDAILDDRLVIPFDMIPSTPTRYTLQGRECELDLSVQLIGGGP
jgi:hypothetical protein